MDRKTKETTSTSLLLTLNGYPFYFPILSFSSFLLLHPLHLLSLLHSILLHPHPFSSPLIFSLSSRFISLFLCEFYSFPFVVHVVLLLYLISFRISFHWLISIEICFRSVCFPFSYLPSDTILVKEARFMLNAMQRTKDLNLWLSTV